MVRLSAVRYGPPTLRDISPIGPIRDRPQSAIWSLRGSPRLTKRLLPLKRPMNQSSFQQPKNEGDDRVDEELIKIDKKSRG